MPVDAMTPNETGEPPALIDMTADEARQITEAIKAAVEQVWLLIRDAYHRRAWLALGYPTWDDYCTKEFRSAPLMVPREERPEMVCSLRQAGLSQRAIASATGVSQSTVRDDLAELSSDHSVPMPDKVTGLDGKKRPAQQPKPNVPQKQPPKPDAPQPPKPAVPQPESQSVEHPKYPRWLSWEELEEMDERWKGDPMGVWLERYQLIEDRVEDIFETFDNGGDVEAVDPEVVELAELVDSAASYIAIQRSLRGHPMPNGLDSTHAGRAANRAAEGR
jgi:hypothetical protein